MIERLEGTRETILYKTENGIRLYHNAFQNDYPLHWHTGIEIIMPYKASYSATIHNKNITIDEGDILIIPPGELHSLRAPKISGERLILQLNYSILFHNSEMRSLITLMKPFYIINHSTFPKITDKLTHLLSQIETEYFASNYFYETKIYSLINNFFVILGRNLSLFSAKTSVSTNQQNNLELFLSVCDYINIHFDQDLTLDDVAQFSGFSKSHFCRFFKNYAGKSFYDYLLNIRISSAANLLLCNKNSILEIALSSGFNSISTFNRVFHNFHRCSPTQYRKLHLN